MRIWSSDVAHYVPPSPQKSILGGYTAPTRAWSVGDRGEIEVLVVLRLTPPKNQHVQRSI